MYVWIEDHLQPISQIPTEFSALAADIQQAIQEYLPNVGWRWSSQLDVCALQGTEIQTPNFSMLTTAAGKRQLWQVMSQPSLVEVSSSHDSN
jgi:DNA polymerase III psi subunit